MKIIQEFKAFAMRGNVVDLAVGVIIGAAFGNIVSSLVSDVIMPPIGTACRQPRFQQPLRIRCRTRSRRQQADVQRRIAKPSARTCRWLEAQKAGPVLAWGDFVTVTLNFVIVAFCIFLMIKLMNKVIRHEEAAAPPTPTEQLLTEIRDLLKNRSDV